VIISTIVASQPAVDLCCYKNYYEDNNHKQDISFMKRLHANSQGVAHLALIVVGVVVLAGIGFAAWRLMDKKKVEDAATSTVEKLNAADCTYDDKDLCKFFTSYKEHSNYKVDITNTAPGGTKTTALFEAEGTEKSHVISNSDVGSFELIVIGKVTYTKASDGTWWKQTQKDDKPNEYTEEYKSDLKEPSKDAPEAEQSQYKKIGTEACGELTCFKYQVVDPKNSDQTQFIWFDTKEYQLRRQTMEDKDGKSDQTFAYSGVNIKEPTPVKELGPNQVLIPGQAEPMTLPTAP
jgi:outer membrane lipoprotein-sorting protein